MRQPSFLILLVYLGCAVASSANEPKVELTVALQELGDGFCWFHPRVAAIPGLGKDGEPAVVMTLQKHLRVSDYYSGLYVMRTDDLGKTWSKPDERPELAWVHEPGGVVIAVADVTPGWHAKTGKLIAIGCMVRYSKEGHQLEDQPRPSQTSYTVHDPKTGTWSKWALLEMPGDEKFNVSRNACSQWIVEPDGKILLPVYYGPSDHVPYSVTVCRCSFDGENLKFIDHGNELKLDVVRGLCEPSIVHYADRNWLTLRNDVKGYVASSKDGLHYDPITPWTFDDGTELGSYNTQQHWLAGPDGLYLCYTRRGADNDHIMRNRAPLLLAKVDTEKRHVIRATEQVLIPERGVPLGNFGAAGITSNEGWVTDAEYMDKAEVHPRGANGSVFVSKVKWAEK